MTRTILSASLMCTLLVVVFPATMTRGEEPASPPRPPVPCRTVAKPAEKETYTVYVSQAGCLRSFGERGQFDNAQAALVAAQVLRKSNKLVWVATGTSADRGLSLHPRMRGKLQVTGCSVYGLSCSRSGWKLADQTATVEQAEQRAEALKKDERLVEVVYHLTSR